MKRLACILAAALMMLECTAAPKQYKLQVVKEYPHDSKAYTQGLFFHSGKLYESTGEYGSSSFRLVELESGKSLRKLDFDKKYFVEGSVIMGGKLYILTWTSKLAFVYDAATLKYEKTFSYPREGWGLTSDGESLIASDGSNRLYFMDKNFRLTKTVQVKVNGSAVRYLNELEWINGKIWANVYTTDLIMIINPDSGEVEGIVNCKNLLPDKYRDGNTDVLNGIAYNPQDGKTYLTGKNWKRLYEIKLIESK